MRWSITDFESVNGMWQLVSFVDRNSVTVIRSTLYNSTSCSSCAIPETDVTKMRDRSLGISKAVSNVHFLQC